MDLQLVHELSCYGNIHLLGLLCHMTLLVSLNEPSVLCPRFKNQIFGLARESHSLCPVISGVSLGHVPHGLDLLAFLNEPL